MRELTGGEPIPVKSLSSNTNEGMVTLFRSPRFFKRYGQRWNTKTAYIGGLHSAYLYLGTRRQGCRRTGEKTRPERFGSNFSSLVRAGLLQGQQFAN